MYYYVYKIENLINNKIYVGRHRGEIHPLDDNYYGSGKLIQRAIKKHGKENFIKTVLHYCYSEEESALLESKIVTKIFISNPNTYNLHEGGFGGWGHWNDGSKDHLEAAIKGGKLRGKKLNDFIAQQKEQNTSWWNQFKEQIQGNFKNNNSWANLSEYEIQKRKNNLSEKSSGKGNSQYGRYWISNVITKEVKRIAYDDIVTDGWVRGKKGHQLKECWINDGVKERLIPVEKRQECLDKGFVLGRLENSVLFLNIKNISGST